MKQANELVQAFLARPLLARIATVDPQTLQPHVVPVWFLWDGEEIWVSGFRSTRKFRELELNHKCAVVVDETTEDNVVRGVLLEGEAVLVTQPRILVEEMSTRIYNRYLGEEGTLASEPQSWIHDPENVLFRMTPLEIYHWK